MASVERKWDYSGKLLWKLRDKLRNALIGDYWARGEVYVVGKKK